MSLQVSTLPPLTSVAPTTRWQRVWAYRWFIFLAGIISVGDQLSKLAIRRALPLGTYGPPDHIVVIPGLFNLVHVGNTGAAWSLFSGRSTVLALLGIGTLVAIFYWRHSLGLRLAWLQVSFGLLCGGIAGNLFDRIRQGHVTDFLDFHFGTYIFPTFNVADSGICIGVGIYLWQSLRARPAPPPA
jgi:signal peptidase II